MGYPWFLNEPYLSTPGFYGPKLTGVPDIFDHEGLMQALINPASHVKNQGIWMYLINDVVPQPL